MAPVIKWQRWDSASYNWNGHSASDPVAAIDEILDEWILAVNANASNVGRQVTKMRDYTDFSGNYNGHVLRLGANSNTEYGYFVCGTHNSTSSLRFYMGDTYTDDTSNGGFGTVNISNGGSSDTSVATRTTGQEGNFLLCYDVADGQEFFTFGPYFPSSYQYQYANGWVIFKTTKGEWAIAANDYTARYCYTYHDDAVSTGWGNLTRNTSTNQDIRYVSTASGYYGRFTAYNGETSAPLATTFGDTYTLAAANDALLYASGSTGDLTGKRLVNTTEDPDRGIYLLTTYYSGPTIYVDAT